MDFIKMLYTDLITDSIGLMAWAGLKGDVT